MTRVAVLTALVGVEKPSTPHLYTPPFDHVDHFFFTDKENIPAPPGWSKRLLYPSSMDKKYEGRRASKIPKILSHLLLADYDYYIWHDYFHYLKEDPLSIIENMKDADMGLFRHPVRNGWLDEMRCAAHRDHPKKAQDTIAALKNLKVPTDTGLWEMSCFIRKNNETANKCFGLWYELVQNLTSRDQVTFPAAIHFTSPKICILPGSALAYGGNNNLIPHIGTSLVNSSEEVF